MLRLLAAVLAVSSWAGTLPLTFVQPDPGRFLTRGASLAASGLLTTAGGVRLRFAGARDARPEGREPMEARANLFLGADPSRWRSGLPIFSRVEYRQLYPGIDVVFYGAGSNLEFDLKLAPSADLRRLRMVFDGAPGLRIGAAGELIAGDLRLLAPDIGRYVLRSPHEAGIDVPGRDPALPLTIDPKILWASYLGGNGVDQANAVALDPAGNVYVAGQTTSTNFPVVNAAQPAFVNSTDVFVAKFAPGGDKLLYATYLGGNGADAALAITVDAGGNAYVTGSTASTNFPVAQALQPALKGGSSVTDAFLTKLSPAGAIVFSTYLGGTGNEFGRGIAIDNNGNIFIGGETSSTDFPVVAPLLPARGARDGFVAKIAPAGDRILWATYLGGTGFDSVNAIALDPSGAVYVCGQSRSADFPTTPGVFQEAAGGFNDGFIAKLTAAGDKLVYSTYFGTRANEGLNGIAVDAAGTAYVAGTTDGGIPLKNGTIIPVISGTAAIIARLNAAATDFVFERLLDGPGDDHALAVAIDAQGNAYFAGDTSAAGFPSAGSPPQPLFGGMQDAFVTSTDANGATLYSTYLGGAQADGALAVAATPGGIAYVAGMTASANFPVTAGAVQGTPGDTAALGDAFVARIGDPPAIAVAVTPASVDLPGGGTQQFTATVTNTANTAVTWSITPATGTISAAGLYTAPPAVAAETSVTVRATSVADPTKSATATVRLTPPAAAIIVSISPSTAALAPGQTQQFTASVTGTANTAVTWSITPATGTISPAGLYTAPQGIAAITTITVRATSVADATKSATAVVTLTRPGPVATAAGLVNGASFLAGPVSPGEIVTLFGTGMGPAALAGLRLTADGLVDNSVAGTRLLFDGTPSPLIYTSAGQVAAVVPYSVAGKSSVQMVVEYQGVQSAPSTVQVAAASPAIFTIDTSGKGQGAILNQDNSYNGAGIPAAADSIVVIYATGEGQTKPPGRDGMPALTVYPKPELPVSVNIGGRNADVIYAGAAPGFVAGVLQVNARIPAGTAPGAVPITLNVGGINSPAGVTVAVK